MQITHLSLQNFRSYVRLELDVPAGVTLLFGENAQGKTNLLEAIYYLATTRSPYTGSDSELINWDAASDEQPIVVGRIVADLTTNRGPQQIEMRLIQERKRDNGGFRRQALVNRRKVRLMDLLTTLRVVQFLPQDVQVLTGSPAGRRRYVDITLCQTDSAYCRALATYNKVLDQRNATLRQIAEEGQGRDLLPIYTKQVARLGSEILRRRASFLTTLARMTERIHYEDLTDGKETIRLGYLPQLANNGESNANHADKWPQLEDQTAWLANSSPEVVAERFQADLDACRSNDIAGKRTTLGPHRDDWRLWVNGRALNSFGSRGQQRTAMLALKLAEIEWMSQETGETPILLLDEVMAELDEQRRVLLLDYVQRGAQAIMTTTDPKIFSPRFHEQATAFRVQRGQLLPSS